MDPLDLQVSVRTCLVFRCLVSPLTSSVWATMFNGATFALVSGFPGDRTKAVAELTIAKTTAAVRTTVPVFIIVKVELYLRGKEDTVVGRPEKNERVVCAMMG